MKGTFISGSGHYSGLIRTKSGTKLSTLIASFARRTKRPSPVQLLTIVRTAVRFSLQYNAVLSQVDHRVITGIGGNGRPASRK